MLFLKNICPDFNPLNPALLVCQITKTIFNRKEEINYFVWKGAFGSLNILVGSQYVSQYMFSENTVIGATANLISSHNFESRHFLSGNATQDTSRNAFRPIIFSKEVLKAMT
jgi:hypothetical protein